MSEESTLQSLKNLAKNSINLVEKCRKPDKKGMKRNHYRIYEDYAVLCDRIRSEGNCWVPY